MQVITFDENGKAQERTFRIPRIPEWTLAKEIGYKPQTTFWQDFSIADRFGVSAIVDTYRRAFKEWRKNLTYVTELSLVLNHKGNYYYQAAEEQEDERHKNALQGLAQLYFALYRDVDNWCKSHLSEDDFDYYDRVTD